MLVVEDNEINQAVIVGMLQSLGRSVDVASDGLEALAVVELRSYELILMDCHMPRMDGFMATRELRRRPGTEHTPVLALTADVFREDRDRCIASGMDDHMTKSVRRDDLHAVLVRWAIGDRRRTPATSCVSESPRTR